MYNNTLNKPNISSINADSSYDKGVSPVWARLLYKGVQKRDKLEQGAKAIGDDPSLLFKGLLGKSLLDKHINPFFKKMLPDSTKIDILKRQFKFQPHDRFDMTLGKKGNTAKLGLNWRF